MVILTSARIGHVLVTIYIIVRAIAVNGNPLVIVIVKITAYAWLIAS